MPIKKTFLKSITDEELMFKVSGGDLDQLKFLFERHHVHVYNFLFKMTKDRILSEDLTQEVFYKIMKYRATYKKGKFVSWMFTIARNCLSTHFRKTKDALLPLETEFGKHLEAPVEDVEEFSHLQKAMDQLNASDRELLILNRFQSIKYNELAEIMDSTPGAVKTKVCRALQKLKLIYFESI